MPYTKQTWADLNPAYPVSAARMGVIENGVFAASGGVYNVGRPAGGTTNDGVAIYAKIVEAAAAGCGIVQLEEGTYLMTTSGGAGFDELRSAANVIVQGAGAGTVIKKNYNGDIFRVFTDNFVLRDLVLDGNRAAGFTGQCVNHNGASDGIYQNVTFKNANLNGVNHSNGSRVQYLGCRFSGNLDSGLFIGTTANCRDCKIANCVIDGTGATVKSSLSVSTAAASTDFNGLQIIGNTVISGANSFGIEVSKGASGNASTGWSVVGNEVKLSANSLGGYSFAAVGAGSCVGNSFDVAGFNATTGAIEVAECTGVAVLGNTILGGTTLTVGIMVDGSNPCTGLTILGNTINGLLSTATGAIRVIANAAGSVFSDIAIGGNNIIWGGSGTGISGILVQTNNASATANRILISDNVVRGNNAATTVGIKLNNLGAGTIDKTTIANNIVSNVATPVSLTGDTNTLIAFPSGSRVLTYSATIATDASLGSLFTIAATNGTAFTISNPTNPVAGGTITYDIKNSSGGAHGVITWGTAFLNGGAGTVGTGAFAGIANGKRRTISFYYDGTSWVETNRAAADI